MSAEIEPLGNPLAAQVQAALSPFLSGEPERVPTLVDRLLAEAHSAGVSDVHLTSRRDRLAVSFRIDGELMPAASIPRGLQDLVIQRLKVMARLVVFMRREPQDGRIDSELGGRTVSLRIAFLPTLHGEQVVVRFPDPGREELNLDQLGMGRDLLSRFAQLIERPQGAVLLTGPASCGKTTTIYAALRHLVAARASDLNILSIEDPIEAEITGISQTQVDSGADFDFPRALRAALRHDPNVLVVGEIRDPVTAQTAIEAALTGHMLIATVHAGSAPGVFTRLAQMGVERYLLATSVSGVLNQRLVRTNCPTCASPSPMDAATADVFGFKSENLTDTAVAEGTGCANCNRTGCKGRIGVFELFVVTSEIREAILAQTTESALADLAREGGQPSLRDAIGDKVKTGVIAPREALRLIR